jgi:hypothetical protein
MTVETVKHSLRIARSFCQALLDAGLSPADGCATLALTYAVWIEAHPEGSPELCRVMMECGQSTSERAFDLLREMRKTTDEMLAEAARAVH